MNKMLKHYIIIFYNKLKSLYDKRSSYPTIINANAIDESEYAKRALLLWVSRDFLLRENGPLFLTHQHYRQSQQVTTVLDGLRFAVDVADVRSRNFTPTRDYDLVIRNKVSEFPLKSDSIRIYLATTMHHKIHNENIRRRHQLLYERRGRRVKLRRIQSESMPYVENADAIIGFGNEYIISTWEGAFNIPVYPFNNYGFKETEFLTDSKDFAMARNSFLFYASKSQVQKGLDLLLEIFPKHPELNLYVCSEFEKEEDFRACYYKELYKTPNIHPVGWVRVNSRQYNELIVKCAYVIHPSCAEGQPGSVVQCMYSGLIPLVTRETGIDTEDFGITFEDDGLEEIERVILEVSRMPESWHREHSIKTRKVSEKKYSEDAFMERWRNMLAEILNGAGKSRLFNSGEPQ